MKKQLLNLKARPVASISCIQVCLFLFLIINCSPTFSQVASYSFAVSSGTYVPISGGTVLGTTTSDEQVFNNNTTGAASPVTSTGFPIGFNFNYKGATYDRFAVAYNGYIVLGTGSFTIANTTNNSLGTATVSGFANLIAPFNFDLEGQTGSELSFLTTGSPGSQVLTVQWKGVKRFTHTSTLNFQIQLFEGTNTIVFIYGACSTATLSTGQCGLRGATNADEHVRTTSTNWNATTLGTSASTVTISSSVTPASGLTFTFNPPPPCTAPVDQPTALNLIPSGQSVSGTFAPPVPASSDYLIVRTSTNSQPSNPVDGISYTAGASALGGTIVGSVTAPSFSATGLTASTTYYFWIYAYNNSGCTGPVYQSVLPLSGSTTTTTCTPSAQPTNLNLTPALTTLSGTFTAAAPAPSGGYLVVRTTTNVQPIPVDGTTYAIGNNAIGYIESSGSSTAISSTGLSPGTTYYYWIFSFNNSSTCATGSPFYLLVSPLSGSAATTNCSISGVKTVGTSADYPNLTNAIATLIANGVTGPVILELNSGYPASAETFPIVLGNIPCAGSLNTITIRPATGVTGKTISGNNATATLDINGGSYWIVDGRAGGVGSSKDLTISNSAAGPAIRFINDASNNLVQFINTLSGATSTTSGSIHFSTTTGPNGNDNNTIDNCNINGTGVNANCIYASGTTATSAQNNSGNTISNCTIYDFFVAGSATNGILISSGNTDWTISGNSIYQTATRTYSVGSTHCGININNSTGNNFTVLNNLIGGTQSGAGGTPWTNAGSVASRFRGISILSGSTIPSNINGNIIRNFNWTSSSGATTPPGVWAGIYLTGGSQNVGSTNGNTIGSSTGTNSVTVATSTTLGISYGIVTDAGSIVNIANNSIGSFNVVGTTASVSHLFHAIATTGGSTININANTIGSATTANSITTSSTATGTPAIAGINCASAGTISITNNLVANLSSSYLPASATSVNVVRGIWISGGVIPTIVGNTVRNLSAIANAAGTGSTASVIGIGNLSSTVGAWSISQNVVHSLSNSHATGAVLVTGIYCLGSSTTGNIFRNSVFALSANSTAAIISGIFMGGSPGTYQNNFVRLGIDATGAPLTTACTIYGMNETSSGPNNIYHNTLYIGGSGVGAGSANSFAFATTVTSGTRAIQNNIFMNERSNGASTGKHYGYKLGTSLSGLTSNYNLIYVTGTGSVFGQYNALDVTSLAAWQTTPGSDQNSKSANPCLANPTAGTPDLHLTDCSGLGSPAESAGTLIASVTDDFDGDNRAILSPVDIGADAGNYGPLGKDVGVSVLTRPTATSCHSINENVIVQVTNYSTSPLNLSTDPVTLTVNVTGTVTANFNVLLDGTTGPSVIPPGGSISVTVGQLNTSANGNYSIVSAATVSGDLNTANDANTTNVMINYTALSVTAAGVPATLCVSGSSTVTATPLGGTAPYTYAWSPGGSTTNAINTGTINSSASYTITVTDACGITSSNSTTVTVNNPQITGTTPKSRCGSGTVTLEATSSPGSTLNWYAAASGGAAIGTGPSFITPVINATTNYYVSAASGASTVVVGLSPTAVGCGTIAGTSSTDYPLRFNTTVPITLQSVTVIPFASGSFTVALRASLSVVNIQSQSFTFTAGQVGIPQQLTLNFAINTPGNYQLTNTVGGVYRIGTFSCSYPMTSPNGSISVVGSATFSDVATNTTSYNSFYNLTVTEGCESSRTLVTATVTAAPTLALTGNTSICSGESTTLAVSSSNDPNYKYTWLPGNLSGGTQIVTPLSATTYTVNALDTTTGLNTGCTATATIPINVKLAPVPVISASPNPVCQGETLNLSVTSTSGTFNYSEGFEGAFPPSGWTLINAGSGNSWITSTTAHSGTKAIQYSYSTSFAANAWAITPAHSLLAGTTYTITFWYRVALATYPEKLKVTVGNSATVAAQTTVLWNNNGGSNLVNTTYALGTMIYTPSATGTYYFGFNCYSDADADFLYIDDISITSQPPAITNYMWSSNPSGFSASTQNPSINPTGSSTYSVTITNALGCTASATTPLINVSPLPATPVAVDSTQCGIGIPAAYVIGNGGSFRWYTSMNGSPIAGEIQDHLTFTSISQTTTFYVSEYDGTCESAKVAVQADVTPSDQITALASPNPVCGNQPLNLSVMQAGSNNNYTFQWTASNPGSGINGSVPGDGIGGLTITPNTGGNYVYTVTASDAGSQCVTSSTVTVTVVVPPVISSAIANPSTICTGSQSTLTALTTNSAAGQITIGTQSSSGISPSPYRGGSGSDCRNQFLFTAAELTAAGLLPGNISSITFNVTSAIGVVPNLSIQIGTTSATTMTTSFLSDPATTIYGPADFTPVSGLNTHTFTPFFWNGTSSIFINTCSPGGGGSSSSVSFSTTAARSIQTAISGACTAATGTLYSQVWIKFGGQVGSTGAGALNWNWNPGSLTGNIQNVTPSVSTAYTVTASDPISGCTSTMSVPVTVVTAASIPTISANPASVCGSGTVTLTVTNPSPGISYTWEASPSGLNGTWTQIGSGTSMTTSTIITDTYFHAVASCALSSEVSLPAFVPVLHPHVTSAPSVSRCGAGMVTMNVTGTGQFDWYAASTGGTPLFTNQSSVTTLVSSATTFWILARDGSCNDPSGRQPLSVSITPAPSVSIATLPGTTVCSNKPVTLTASSSNDPNYSYQWTTNGTTFIGTGSVFVANPVANTTYSVYAQDNTTGPNAQCGSVASVAITVLQAPAVPMVSPSPASICIAGGSTSLSITNVSLPVPGTVSIGTNNTTEFAASPYRNGTNAHKAQYLYTASELTAAGLTAGNFTSLAFTITSNGSPVGLSNYSIAISHTAVSTLSTSFETGPFTTVYGPVAYSTVTGLNSHLFTTPFAWNGTSNIIIQICHEATSPSSSSTVAAESIAGRCISNPVFTVGSVCASATSTNTGNRPIMQLGGQVGTGISYLWAPGGATTPSLTVSPVTSTIYTVQSTLLNGCSSTNSVQVIYAPITAPSIIPSGSTTICQGQGISLDAGTGYASYSWSDGSGVVGASQILTSSPSSSKTYTVTVSSGGNCTSSASQAITVNPVSQPVISNSSALTFCQGDSVILNAGSGFASYSWNDGNSIVGNQQTLVAYLSAVYSVTVTAANGCTATASKTVSNNPKPPVPIVTPSGSQSICINSSSPLTLTADTSGAGSGAVVSWNDLFNLPANSYAAYWDDIEFQLHGNTYSFHATVTNSFGCHSVSNDVTVNVISCGASLNLKVFLQGYYISSGQMINVLENQGVIGATSTQTDTIHVELHSTVDPTTILDMVPAMLMTNGQANCSFSVSPGSYWLVVKHRNSIQTWSAAPVMIPGSYDFTTASSKAYADNMIDVNVEGIWSVFTGDINQDEFIDIFDFPEYDFANQNFVSFEYATSDLNGDGFVDIFDFPVFDLNNQNFISSIHP